MWDFSNTAMTFDNPGYLFDGTAPGVTPPPPPTSPNIMPSVVGMEFYEAILELQQVGIFSPGALGYFGTFPIAIIWVPGPFPGIVQAQSIAPGTFVPANTPMTLTVSEFPISVAFP